MSRSARESNMWVTDLPKCDTLSEQERKDLVTYLHQDTGWQEAGDRLRRRFRR